MMPQIWVKWWENIPFCNIKFFGLIPLVYELKVCGLNPYMNLLRLCSRREHFPAFLIFRHGQSTVTKRNSHLHTYHIIQISILIFSNMSQVYFLFLMCQVSTILTTESIQQGSNKIYIKPIKKTKTKTKACQNKHFSKL